MLASWDKGQLPNIPEDFLKNRMLITIFGISVATLKAQNPDGSWGIKSSRETTAYALIALATTASLPLASCIGSQLRVATNAGRDFLLQHRESWSEPDYIWRGKITFGSGVFAETYVVTALAMATPSHKLGPSVDRLCELEDQHHESLSSSFTHLPIFSDTPAWLVEAAIIEGYLYKPMVRHASQDIFPRRDIVPTKHIDMVPSCWTCTNHIKGASMSPTMMFQMMVACLLIYEIDHYMEQYIARLGPTEINSLRALISNSFDERDSVLNTSDDGISEIPYTLNCFTNWYLQTASGASRSDQTLLKKELRVFLLAQVTSVKQSSQLANFNSHSASAPVFNTTETFYDWVHGTSTEHAGGQLLFSFLSCLLGAQQQSSQDCFPSVKANYLAQDLSAHLGTLARIENDCGSVARDLKERNLNSVNFPEFFTKSADGISALNVSVAKERLKQLSDFERECSELIMRRLESLVELKTLKSLRTFRNVIYLGGQIYAVDDFSPTVEKCL